MIAAGASLLKTNFLICAVIVAVALARAQEPAASDARTQSENKYWLSGQVNLVGQVYPSFPAAYSGPSSFSDQGQAKPTWVATIYTGYAPFKNTEFFFDVESARGSGVSGALGLGGLGNLDAVTDPNASAAPYIARAMVRHIIPLSSHIVDATRNPLGLAPSLPDRRLELRVGKMSLTDFFDLNAVGSDSHLQFLNYAIDNNATYDIAANSRGYTYAALAELYAPLWTARFAEALEPTNNTGQHIDWNVSRSRSENIEFELHPNFQDKQPFTIRALSFFDHGEMGSYPAAVSGFISGQDPTPDLSAHIKRSLNWGVGFNGETSLPRGIRLFGRVGWTKGTEESYQFAEADRTFALGGDFDGRAWKHKVHKMGVALAIDGLASAHRTYLSLGGQSYLLDDGRLDYGREKILEGYYNVPIGRGIFGAFDVQRIWNPGYNQARGPVIIFGFRLHLEGDFHFN